MALHIKSLLHGFLHSSAKKTWQIYLLQHWNSVIGELHVHVQLEKVYDDGTLVLGVADTSWLQELHCLSSMIIENINANLDKPYVKRIRLRYKPQKHHKKKTVIKKFKPTKPIILTLKEQKALERIEDKQLQQALHAFFVRCCQE